MTHLVCLRRLGCGLFALLQLLMGLACVDALGSAHATVAWCMVPDVTASAAVWAEASASARLQGSVY